MKNEIIVSGVYDIFKARKKYLYEKYKDLDSFKNYSDLMNEEQFDTCNKIYKNQLQRKYKIKERLNNWLYAIKEIPQYKDYIIVFGTLTFNDKLLKNKKETRRKYVERFLREQTEEYISNIDYGKINDREHYHFIALVKNKINCKEWRSIINIKKIPIKMEDRDRVKNYLMKLNNHTFKESTRNEKLLVDKNRKIEKWLKLRGNKEIYQNWKIKNA